MAQKLSKRGIYACVLAVILAVCLALGIYFLLPNSAAVYAEDNSETFSHTDTEHKDFGWTGTSNINDLSINDGGTYYYYLTDNVSGNITISNGTLYLCLNGNVITGLGDGSVITINSDATLYLCDCGGSTTQAHYYHVSNCMYVFCGYESDPSSCTETTHTDDNCIEGGIITGGSTMFGGGVYVNDNATFKMYGGTISGNEVMLGGGVYVWESGSFTMYGGTISGNRADMLGGGVYVESGTFKMYGGTISGNEASHGGGVYVLGGEFTMNGGTISDNNAAGGVFVLDGTFTMNGGYLAERVEGNGTIAIKGGNFSDSAWETLQSYYSGTPETNTGDSTYTYGVVSNSTHTCSGTAGVTSATAISSSTGTLTDGSYYLSCDVKTSLTISSGTTVYLCLNGNTLTGNDWSVITISNNATLILYDCSRDGSGKITGGIAANGGGVYVEGGTFEMNGGTISGNGASYGGGVYVKEFGTFEMYGGTISSNEGTYSGGGVYVEMDGTFTMNGGTISGNSADWGGGGVYVLDGTFTMNGGTISDNSTEYGSGGGVYVLDGTFTMNGATISDNEATYYGGGVYVYGGTFEMESGTISDNGAEWGSGVSVAVSGVFELSGGTVSDNTAFYGGIYVEGAFKMYGGTISDNDAYFGGGVYVFSGTFTMNGGEISNNSTWYYGGVYVNVGAIFTMNDGNISNNNAEWGGGVFAYYGTFEMCGGAISGNNASYGDSVFVYESEFNMYSGRLDGSVYTDGGTISIKGGYLSQSACDSVVYEDTNYIDSTSEIIEGTGYELWVYAVIPYGANYNNTATCTEGGVGTYTYTIGEKNYSITVITSATGHSVTHYAAIAATCTTGGNEEYWYCESCENYFSDKECKNGTTLAAVTLSATGHNTTHYAPTEATETEEGNCEYWYCEDCKKYFLDSDGNTETTPEELTIAATGESGDGDEEEKAATSSPDTVHYIAWGCIAGEVVIGGIIAAIAVIAIKRRRV